MRDNEDAQVETAAQAETGDVDADATGVDCLGLWISQLGKGDSSHENCFDYEEQCSNYAQSGDGNQFPPLYLGNLISFLLALNPFSGRRSAICNDVFVF